LALAYRDEFQLPQLRLYNARTGEPVRQFTGHLAAITSLAFSADGRLLVSAAEDQTVCVWSLDGLDKVWGQRGQIRGLAVRDGKMKNTVEVSHVAEDSPARDKLKPGEVLEELTAGDGKPQGLTSALTFYRAVWLQKPGTRVTLTLPGQRKVALAV